MVAIPTIDLMDIVPQFVKDHIFFVVLAGDTAITSFFNFVTGSNFAGIIGSIIGFVLSFLINLITNWGVSVYVATWHIFFIFLLVQFGVFGLIYKMLMAQFSATGNR